MRASKTFHRQGRLNVLLRHDELLIAGNREGLLSLASLIADVANLPYSKELYGLEHEHVGFGWYDALLSGRLRIQLGKTPLTPPTKTRDGTGRDVTVLLTRKPALLLNKPRRHARRKPISAKK